MGLRLNRHLGDVRSLDAGQWTDRTASGKPAIACPGCGSISEIDDTHTISPDGLVTPIWSCASQACPLMEWIALEAWAEEVVP